MTCKLLPFLALDKLVLTYAMKRITVFVMYFIKDRMRCMHACD